MNLTEKDKSALKFGGIMVGVFILVATFGLAMRYRSAHKNPEDNFTPEQRQVLQALRSARVDLETARAQLEQTKQQMNDFIISFKGVAVSKGFDPNVNVTWLPMNGQPVKCGDKEALWGFRADGTVTWKCP